MKRKNSVAGPPVQKKEDSIWLKLALFSAFLLSGLSSATQYFAYTMRYQDALGTHINHIYPPWCILEWYGALYPYFPRQLTSAASIGAGLTVTLMLIYFVATVIKSNTGTTDAKLHGSARWATKKEIANAGLLSSEGVFVGAWKDEKGKIHYLRHNGPEHVLCYAPTRSGKGVGLVIPTLLTWPKSVVISDIKGELWALTAGWRQKYAQNKTIRFEPAAKGQENEVARWNVFDEIRIGTDYETADAQLIAELIVDPDGKGLDDHWKKTAKALLEGCILHLLYLRKNTGKDANMSALDAMLADSSRPIRKLWDEMIHGKHLRHGMVKNEKGLDEEVLLDENLWKTHPVVSKAAQDMKDRPEEEAGSVLSTAKSNLSLYRDPVVAKNVSASDYVIHDLMNSEQPVSLYIITQPPDKDRMKPLVRLLITMIVRIQASSMEFVVGKRTIYTWWQKIMRRIQGKSIRPTGGGRSAKGKYKHRQLLMIDEFPSLGRLGILQESLAFIAGYGMKFYGICQDRNQLTDKEKGYGPDESITSNCHIQIAYAPNRPETAEMLSKMTGQTTIVKEQISASGKIFGTVLSNVSRSYQEVQRPLLTLDECMRLPGPKKDVQGMITEAGDMLVFVAGYNPVYGKQPLYFQDEVLTARSEVDPPKKTDSTRIIKQDKQYMDNSEGKNSEK